jgi:hypothetical protein
MALFMRVAITSLLFIAAIAAARPAAAQTQFVADPFTVGANTMLEAHVPNTQGTAWARQTGTNGIIINAGADNARNAGAGDWSVYSNGTIAPAAEVVVGATVTFTNASTNNFVDLFGRASVTLLQAYSVRLVAGGANNLTLTRWSGGTPTTIATATVAISLNTPIGIVLSLKNASKTVLVNNVTVASSADNVVTAAGFVALGMQSNVAAQTIVDDFYAGTFSPTAVDRLDATATREAARTLIEWSTAREVQNLGFRIYRDDGKGLKLVTRGLIAGAGFMMAGAALPAGNVYRWVDADPRAPEARAWWIEDVDLRGNGVWHGPIVPQTGHINTGAISSPAFVDLRQRDGVVTAGRLRPVLLAESMAGTRRRAADPSAGPREKQRQLAASNAIKMGVAADGLYGVSHADLVAGGLDAATDLQSLRLYADGMEEPLAVDSDAIMFYGRALDTVSTGTRVYWLTSGEGAGMRMASASPAGAAVSGRRSFLATAERRDKQLLVAFLRNPPGDGFVGPIVSSDASKPTTQMLQVRHIDRYAVRATLKVELQGASDASGEVDHRVAVSLNGHPAGEITFSGMTRPVSTMEIPSELLAEGDNVVSLVALNGDADLSVVVSVALTYAHTLAADDDRLLAVVDGGAETSISGFTSDDVQIIDVTNERAPIRILPLRVEAGTVTFDAPGAGARVVLAVAGSKVARVASITRNEPAALHAAEGSDVVIISHQSFVDALGPLVQLREKQGLRVMVVKIDDVYDEYNFGAKDPEAIHSFLRDARNWQRPPRYVLLIGDATFDARNYLGFGDSDFVPTKLVPSDLLETASDTWFTDFDDDGAPDIPIGRLSARVASEVAVEVRKIIAFESSAAPTPSKVMLVSDSDPSLGFHARSVSLKERIPQAFEVVDVDAAASGPVAARQQLMAGFGDALLVNYIGHGSVEIWSGDGLFSSNDVATLPNGRPPIVVAMTCLNGYFHDVYTESLAETLLRAPNGAVAVWASSALTTSDEQLPANQALLAALLSPGDVRLGDAILAAQKSSSSPDIRRTFTLFGDPAMRVRANQ